MATDPRAIIDREPMSRFQWTIVGIMIGLNALDGFDVLSISFASPGMARDWGIDRGALGIVLSMELIGMAVGSLLLGGTADRVGRRRTILGCLAVMALGMFGAGSAHDVTTLSLWRIVTGLGIGGMLAATNAAVAEAANATRRNLAVALMAGGYPVGTVVGGLVSTRLLADHGWSAVFVFGGAATLCFIPMVLLFAPESISFLMEQRRPDALARINRVLARMGRAAVDALPEPAPRAIRIRAAALFEPAFLYLTVALTIAYLAHIMTFYFVLKWIPKVVADMGFAPSLAAGILVWASIGGACGSLLLGLLTSRLRVYTLTMAAMLGSTVAIVAFGRANGDLFALSLIAAIAGCATNAGVVGLYALVAASFPTHLRATATGFVIGVGRGGSALAPAVAGLLFKVGYGLSTVATLMALGSAVAAFALFSSRGRLHPVARARNVRAWSNE